MVSRETLMSHPIKYLRDEVKKANIMGFATMKKDKLVDEMMKRKGLFDYIVPSGRKGRVSYEGRRERKARTKKEREELKKTKRGRLMLIQEKIDALPANASKGRIESLKAQLRAERAKPVRT